MVSTNADATVEEGGGGVGPAIEHFLKLVLDHRTQKQQQQQLKQQQLKQQQQRQQQLAEEEERQRLLEQQHREEQSISRSASNSYGSLDVVDTDISNNSSNPSPTASRAATGVVAPTIVIATTGKITTTPYLPPNKELDLLDRYRPKDYSCCFGMCPPSWFEQLWQPKEGTYLHPTTTATTTTGVGAMMPSYCIQ